MPSKSKKSSKLSELQKRVLSAALLIPAVLALVWIGGTLFNVAMFGVLFYALYEWYNMAAPKLAGRGKFFAYAIPVVVVLVAYLKGMPYATLLALLSVPLLWFYVSKQHKRVKEKWEGRAPWVSFGLPYLVASVFALIYLRNVDAQNLDYVVYLLAVVWGTDIGAFFAGRHFGGAKLLPKISPKKTWSGLIGGMVTAGILGYVIALYCMGGAEPFAAAILAMIMAIVAQAGDFVVSYVKRQVGAKDTGKLIPGHGGLLDRIDGLLPAAMLLAVVVMFVR